MNDKKPLFSIATPCWNSEDTIERTIKSILEQDFKDYEYIIVDGGSTDGTLDIIKKYEPLFEGRMHWKSEPDKGLYDAFNKGVKRSHGVYCWNVNADDYLEPDALLRLADFINKNNWKDNLPVISGKLNFVSRDGKKIFFTTKSDKDLAKKSYERDHMGVPHTATLVPKMIYDKLGCFDIKYKIMGDVDWFHRVYKAGEQFVFADITITNMADGGVSNLFNYKQCLKDRLYYYKNFYNNPIERLLRLSFWTASFYKQKFEHIFMK